MRPLGTPRSMLEPWLPTLSRSVVSRRRRRGRIFASVDFSKPTDYPDRLFRQIARAIQEQIDCKTCANYCRETRVNVAPMEIDMLAQYLNLPREQVAKEYTTTDPEDRETILRHAGDGWVFLTVISAWFMKPARAPAASSRIWPAMNDRSGAECLPSANMPAFVRSSTTLSKSTNTRWATIPIYLRTSADLQQTGRAQPAALVLRAGLASRAGFDSVEPEVIRCQP